jgi:hypothetical protein
MAFHTGARQTSHVDDMGFPFAAFQHRGGRRGKIELSHDGG